MSRSAIPLHAFADLSLLFVWAWLSELACAHHACFSFRAHPSVPVSLVPTGFRGLAPLSLPIPTQFPCSFSITAAIFKVQTHKEGSTVSDSLHSHHPCEAHRRA